MPREGDHERVVVWGDSLSFACESATGAMVRMTARSEARGRRRAWLGQLLAAVGVALLALDAATWMTGVAALGGVRLWAAAAAVCGALLWKSASQAVVAETVLVLGDVGVQLITSFRGGGSTKRLVDASRVRAAIINEHVALSGVHNYVGLVVDGLDHMEVLFPVSREARRAGPPCHALLLAQHTSLASELVALHRACWSRRRPIPPFRASAELQAPHPAGGALLLGCLSRGVRGARAAGDESEAVR